MYAEIRELTRVRAASGRYADLDGSLYILVEFWSSRELSEKHPEEPEFREEIILAGIRGPDLSYVPRDDRGRIGVYNATTGTTRKAGADELESVGLADGERLVAAERPWTEEEIAEEIRSKVLNLWARAQEHGWRGDKTADAGKAFLRQGTAIDQAGAQAIPRGGSPHGFDEMPTVRGLMVAGVES